MIKTVKSHIKNFVEFSQNYGEVWLNWTLLLIVKNDHEARLILENSIRPFIVWKDINQTKSEFLKFQTWFLDNLHYRVNQWRIWLQINLVKNSKNKKNQTNKFSFRKTMIYKNGDIDLLEKQKHLKEESTTSEKLENLECLKGPIQHK